MQPAAPTPVGAVTSWRDAVGTSLQRMQYYLRAHLLLDRSKLHAHDEVVVVGAGSNKQQQQQQHDGDADAFVDAVVQRQMLYFSYRYRFAPLPNAMTSDAGWGCLLRTSQMLLAHALVRHCCDDATARCDAAALSCARECVCALFMDKPTAPFGIHTLQHHLHNLGVAYGTLLTPTQMGTALAAACDDFCGGQQQQQQEQQQQQQQQRSLQVDRDGAAAIRMTRPLVALCCTGGDVDVARVRSLLDPPPLPPPQQQQQQQQHTHPDAAPPCSVLLLIPLNLGLGCLSTKYAETLRRLLAMRSTCGIAGGTHATSVLYIGFQHDTLVYLDPHFVQRAYTSAATYGRRTALRAQLSLHNSNTSMLLGCYLRDGAALDAFAADLLHVNAPLLFPLITLATRAPTSRTARKRDAGEDIELLSFSDDADAPAPARSAASSTLGEAALPTL